MTPHVTWQQALAWRMERQLIEPTGTLSAVDVVRRLGGVQAQVASSAELAVRLRQQESPENEVAEALASGRLVKTWAMRGTLHLLPADAAGPYLSLLAASRSWERVTWQRYFGMSPAQMEGLRGVVREILDGRAMTRDELSAEIVKRPGYESARTELESGWGTLFKPLAWQGDIAFGPNRGSRPTFARPEQISPHWQPIPTPDEAGPRVIDAYLGAYGPATPTHVRNWVARGRVSAKQLGAWFDAMDDQLTKVRVDGRDMFIRAADVEALLAAKPSNAVRLLGGFDQWLLGPGTDDAQVIPRGRRRNISRTAGWISPVVIVDGVARGTWALDSDRVAVNWFRESGSVPSAALEKEADRLSRLVGRPLSLEVVLVD